MGIDVSSADVPAIDSCDEGERDNDLDSANAVPGFFVVGWVG